MFAESPTRLFILGNGFDLAHGRFTAYKNFKNYLEYGYLDDDYVDEDGIAIQPRFSIDDIVNFPPSPENEDGGLIFVGNEGELITWFLTFMNSLPIDESWSNYEKMLTQLDYEAQLELIQPDDNPWIEMEDTEDLANAINIAITAIHHYFVDWIKAVQSFPIKSKCFTNLIGLPRSTYFTFNYTDTLEKYYSISPSQINHIHGCANDSESDLIVGGPKTGESDYLDQYPGGGPLDDLNASLQKSVLKILNRNSEYFCSLSKIKYIYIHGFSFGEVDMPYIKRIKESVQSQAIWYVDNYNHSGENYKDILVRKLDVSQDRIVLKDFRTLKLK